MDPTALLAEFLGTFLVVLSLFASGANPAFIGAAYGVVTFFTSKISGANLNPAVSAAMYARGSLTTNEFLAYVTAQLAAGVASLYTFRVFA